MWFYKLNQMFFERLQHDADLLLAIENIFKQHDMRMGCFAVIGAVKGAHIAFYNQEEKQYIDTMIDKPAEILSCIGNVSEIEGKISVHAHIKLGYEDSSARGGHLLEGTVIFAAELFGVALEGEQLQRTFDEVTGLNLWAFEKNPY
jgi:hypothetical protein